MGAIARGVLAIAMATLSGCTGQASASGTVGTPTHTLALPTASQSADPLASPSLEGMFVVDNDGRSWAMECWGNGDPTVFIETPDDQYWLQTSDDAEQVLLQGGMEVIDTQAKEAAS